MAMSPTVRAARDKKRKRQQRNIAINLTWVTGAMFLVCALGYWMFPADIHWSLRVVLLAACLVGAVVAVSWLAWPNSRPWSLRRGKES